MASAPVAEAAGEAHLEGGDVTPIDEGRRKPRAECDPVAPATELFNTKRDDERVGERMRRKELAKESRAALPAAVEEEQAPGGRVRLLTAEQDIEREAAAANQRGTAGGKGTGGRGGLNLGDLAFRQSVGIESAVTVDLDAQRSQRRRLTPIGGGKPAVD